MSATEPAPSTTVRTNITEKINGGDTVDADKIISQVDNFESAVARNIRNVSRIDNFGVITNNATAAQAVSRIDNFGVITDNATAAQAVSRIDNFAGSRLNPATTNIAVNPTTFGDQMTQFEIEKIKTKERAAGIGDGGRMVIAIDEFGGGDEAGPIEITPKTDKLSEQGLTVPDNVLLNYVSPQYHIILSMVPETKLVNLQRGAIPLGATRQATDRDSLQQSLANEGAVPFASTGDSYQSDLVQFAVETPESGPQTFTAFTDGKNYYCVESFTFESSVAPSPTNPFVATMLNGRIKLVEPHGFKFAEDVRRISNKIGYDRLNTGRIVWRIDIYFSGYNQDSGEWESFIELDVRTKKTRVLTYYINFAMTESKLDHTGTTFDISFVPASHSAYRPEEIMVDAGAVLASKGDNFGSYLDRLATSLEVAVTDRTAGQVQRIYEFKAPPELLAASFYSGAFASKKNALSGDPQSGTTPTSGRDITLIDLLEGALKDLPFVWQSFLKPDDKKHLQPRIHWSIRFNVVFDSSPNSGLDDYTVITNQYIIEPFVTYKGVRLNNREMLHAVIEPAAQIQRVRNMVAFGMVNRVYNYINTAHNQEVIDLDLRFKNYYYHTLFSPQGSSSSTGNMQVEAAASQVGKFATDFSVLESEGTNSDSNGSAVSRNQETTTDNTLLRIFGRSIENPAASCESPDLFRTPFDIYGGGFGEIGKSDYAQHKAGSDQLERAEYEANLNDHLGNDLLKMEMQVRGDPIWLLSPYSNHDGNLITISGIPEYNIGTGPTALVKPQSSKCFFLRLFTPQQNDFMNPNRQGASTACSITGGFYEVTKVNNVFEGGKFTQTLFSAKINHLNYIENLVGISSNQEVDTTGGSKTTVVPKTNTQPSFDLGGIT
jgi:hypothetical protein